MFILGCWLLFAPLVLRFPTSIGSFLPTFYGRELPTLTVLYMLTKKKCSTVYLRGVHERQKEGRRRIAFFKKKNVKQFDILLFALDNSLFRGQIISASAARLLIGGHVFTRLVGIRFT